MFKKPSKKNAKFPSHEFVRQNAEDIFGSVATLIVMAAMFQPTQDIACKIVFLVSSDDHYFNSMFDFANYFFYALCWVVLSVNVQHYIVNFFTRHSNYSRTKLFDFTFGIHLVIFHLASLSFGVYCLVKQFSGNLTISALEAVLKGFFDGESESSTNFHTKLLIHFQISYYLHHFLMVYLLRVQRDFVFKHILYIFAYFGTLVVAQQANCFSVMLMVVTLHSMEQFLWNLYFCFSVRFKGKLSSFLYLVWNVGIFSVCTVLIAFSGICMTNDVVGVLNGSEVWKLLLSFRFAALLALFVTQIWFVYRAIAMLVSRAFGLVSSEGSSELEEPQNLKVEDATGSKKSTVRKRKKY